MGDNGLHMVGNNSCKRLCVAASAKVCHAARRYDDERQGAINLFLGHFVPRPHEPALWDLESDHYLHSGAALHERACCRQEPSPVPKTMQTGRICGHTCACGWA